MMTNQTDKTTASLAALVQKSNASRASAGMDALAAMQQANNKSAPTPTPAKQAKKEGGGRKNIYLSPVACSQLQALTESDGVNSSSAIQAAIAAFAIMSAENRTAMYDLLKIKHKGDKA